MAWEIDVLDNRASARHPSPVLRVVQKVEVTGSVNGPQRGSMDPNRVRAVVGVCEAVLVGIVTCLSALGAVWVSPGVLGEPLEWESMGLKNLVQSSALIGSRNAEGTKYRQGREQARIRQGT